MKLVHEIVADSDSFRLNVVAVDPSPAGLFKLRTAVEHTFPGVEVSRTSRVERGLSFALAGHDNVRGLTTMDTDEFNRLVGVFDPVGKVAEAGPFEVQAMLGFEPTTDFCDRLCELMGQGVSRVQVSSLHDSLLSITVDDLNGDGDHAMTVVEVDDLLHHLLCCIEQK